MNTRRIASALAICMAAGSITLVVGCGSSDSASTAAADTAATSTGTTSTTGTATGAAPAKTLTCIGAEEACTVKVPIGGGASNERIAVELTGTNMDEPTVDIDPEYADSYSIGNPSFTTGGSVYEFTLNAVESIPEGTVMELTFAQKQ